MRRASVVLALFAGLLIAAPAAGAADRYASPTGTGPSPCLSADPCDVATALKAGSGIADGDTVHLAAGTYPPQASALTTADGVRIVGDGERPVLQFTAGGLVMPYTAGTPTISSIENVEVRAVGANAIVMNDPDGSLSRVIGFSTSPTASGAGCSLSSVGSGDALDARIDNSLCVGARAGLRIFSQTGGAASLNNVTAVGTNPADSRGLEQQNLNSGFLMVQVYNSILRATGSPAINKDISVSNGSGASGGTSLHSSNYDSFVAPADSVVDQGGRQTVRPTFVDEADGDFREAPGSVTVDAGDPAGVVGTLALDGNPRVRGGRVDIGAYELEVPELSTLPATVIGESRATLNGAIDPTGRTGTAGFQFGTGPGFGSEVGAADVSGAGSRAISATIEGLAPSTTYHYRTVFRSGTETFTGPDRSFTTTAAGGGGGGGGGGDKTAPGITGLRLSPKKPRSGKGAKAGFTLSEAASVELLVERSASGHRTGKRCRPGRPKKAVEKKCSRFVQLARATIPAPAGPSLVPLPSPKKLKTGAYRLSLTATDTAGNASSTKRLSFRVLPKRR